MGAAGKTGGPSPTPGTDKSMNGSDYCPSGGGKVNR